MTGTFSGNPERDRVLFQKSGKGPGPFSEKLSQLIGGAGKTTFFGGFLPVFCPVLCFFTDSLYMKRIFNKKIGPSLLFLAAGTTDTKFLGSTGVTTANSTNKYQKYKSVELGDQLIRSMRLPWENCDSSECSCNQILPHYTKAQYSSQVPVQCSSLSKHLQLLQCLLVSSQVDLTWNSCLLQLLTSRVHSTS